jgi:hypothetical protein
MRYSAVVRPTTRFALALLTSVALVGACRREPEDAAPDRDPPTLEREQVPVATERDIQAVDGALYSRSLVEQLDLIPPDADGYLVIRDLRPLLDQARRVEQVMAGPLARAIPALAKLGGGTGEGRLAQLGRAHDTLELLLAGVEAAGVELDRGLVVAFGKGAPLIVFAATDLARLSTLASLVGEGVEFSKLCGQLAARPGWYACSLGDPEALARYVPAEQGQALAQRLADRMGAASSEALEPINVALSLADAKQPFDAILRTDAGLWELTLPLPVGMGEQLLRTGPAPALRALVPGTSFAWVRVDPAALADAASTLGPLSPGTMTGELWFGAFDSPDGLVAQLGISNLAAATSSIESLALLLPDEPIQPEELGGLKLDLDRASIELDGQRVPTVGVDASGAGSAAWVETLGVEARARLWAHGEYISVALGEVQAIPAALGRLEGVGPSAAAISTLPPSVGRALLAGEVALLVHLVLDHWQAPPSEAELDALLAGLPQDSRPSAIAITSSFQALAPWSSVDVWLSRSGTSAPWLLNLSVVPFAAEGGGVEATEAAAAAAALDAVLAGSDGVAEYRELLAAYPRSPRVSSYRARAGDAPEHHAVASMMLLGGIGAVAIPALIESMGKAKSSEAPAQTQSMLSAALQVVERDGCETLVGETKLTPPRSVACHEGEGGRCRPSEGPKFSAGEYASSAWAEDPLWAVIDTPPRGDGHRFHYQFRGEAVGKGGCRLTVSAFGDLDGDGVFSTYEREATVAADGKQSLTPMKIEQPDE